MDDFEHRVHVDSGRVRYPGQEAIARLRAEVESLQAQLQAGESFHAVATQQRDAAWREVEALKLQRTAADLVHRDTSTTVLVQAGEIEELRRSNGALLRTKDALQRELARVRAEVEEGDRQSKIMLDSYADENQRISDERDRLRAEVEALRADAETKRGLLLWALYRAQGGSSPVGQPIRRHLGIEQHAHLTLDQIQDAARAAQGDKT